MNIPGDKIVRNVSIANSLRAGLLLCTLFIINAAQAAEVKIYAAASLTDAITELAKIYQQTHTSTQIQPVFAGSSTLARQIENGAPADVFISADKDWADYLQTRNLLEAKSRMDLLANELVLIAPAIHPRQIPLKKNTNLATSFKGKLCTGEPASVPVGKYAKQALVYYGWWDAIQTRLVGTEDVRSALAFIERGECALGIVYKTDALLTKKVTTIATFPAESHLPIVYPGGLTKNANPDARAFWQFLQSKAALEIFSRYGFKAAH
mgnify:CR=1 FL=1